MEVAVHVSTFGDGAWRDLATRRALPSIEGQGFAEVVDHHGGTSIAEARNEAARRSSAPWLCFLDADDELEPGYLSAMSDTGLESGLLAPSIREVVHGAPGPARVLDDRNVSTMNPCVIGTLIRRTVFDDVGGFWSERAWEDWSLFRRAWLAGEQVHHIADAVYRVHVNPDGRNSTVDRPRVLHREIIRAHTDWHRQRNRRRR